MRLYVNLFADRSSALLETTPQGEASIPVNIPAAAGSVVEALLTSEEASSALAALFLAGATAGERAVRRGKPE